MELSAHMLRYANSSDEETEGSKKQKFVCKASVQKTDLFLTSVLEILNDFLTQFSLRENSLDILPMEIESKLNCEKKAKKSHYKIPKNSEINLFLSLKIDKKY